MATRSRSRIHAAGLTAGFPRFQATADIAEPPGDVRPAAAGHDLAGDLVGGRAVAAVAIAEQRAAEAADLVGEQLARAAGREPVGDAWHLRASDGHRQASKFCWP